VNGSAQHFMAAPDLERMVYWADPERGEIVKAFVVLTDPDSGSSRRDLVAELQNHVKQYTAPYKYPRAIEFVNELPKTVSGKIQRNLLRSRETA